MRKLSDDGARGFIIRSDVKNIFCAGLDIRQLYQKETEEMVDFWHLLQDSWYTMYTLNQPMIAAVNGAAIAGGCLIACCADKRLMTNKPKTRIGYSAPMLGMVTPTFVMSTFQSIVGNRKGMIFFSIQSSISNWYKYRPKRMYLLGNFYHLGNIIILLLRNLQMLQIVD